MRRATIRTRRDDLDPALLARALRPDNTDEMQTTVADDGTLETRIERETTGGLHATVDDYVVNLEVAAEVAGLVGTVDGSRAADGAGAVDAVDDADAIESDTDASDPDATDATRDVQTDRPVDAGTASSQPDDTTDNE